ncbi:type I restriction-modification system subunit M [Flavobacterium sp. F-65]|uniref:site-specific DNA-methyltransferase (adenine-specific) n=1 Tax=Flavobacterium pisciphilum TaxID=2893755 RepID=A0ABS8MR89_9FLAO|nr:class I SAM-dependent DNA methyltransferase [Flavobacterium sp. F-65]MCC9071269.1 type I restriction-modification system subunit M [Flavobacterium sp. F-65]
MITGEIKSQVDKIWESFWTGGVSNPLTVIEQFTYLLFIRRLDETQLLEERKAAMIKQPVTNVIYTEVQHALRWSSFKNNDPQTMFDLFTKPVVDGLSVFEHMKQVGTENGVFAKYMSGATFMIPTPRVLDQVVQMVDKIKMEDRDTKGDVYEYLLSKIASSGTNGQFRTPRHIIRMMVDMVQPTKEDTICDPSAGTAGFLITAGEYLHQNHPDWFHEKGFRDHYNSKMFTGVEFDNTMLRIGAMNLQLHGIENPNLIGKDALSESNADVRDQFSLILANPPFKGSLDYDGVESSILKVVKSKKTELLFLGLMLRMMKTGGRCAVIVPDGVLFGSSNAHKQIRSEIVQNHKLDAVISMPSGVFKPYAGVSTAVLFFTKTGTGGTDNVWFYDMQADGYTLDDKRSETKDNDIPDIVSRYLNLSAEVDRKRTDKSFLVPVADLQANDWDLSINRYKEVVYEEVAYGKPANIIRDIKNLQEENKTKLLILEELLG